MFEFIVENAGLGIFAVDREMRLRVWNRFMAVHSGASAASLIGRNLFDCFPELPQRWLESKLRSVFLLNSFAFTAWEQRPWLFRFRHDRPLTGAVEYMHQNCTFMPVRGESGAELVCVTIADVTDLAIAQRRMEQALAAARESAERDALTGVHNRRFFQSRIEVEFSRAQRYGGALSLLLLDLDHFKRINDQHGHPAGDDVLRGVSARVVALLRKSDVLCRYGGEEFAVILPETGIDGACAVAGKLIGAVRSGPVQTQSLDIPVTVSVGVAAAGAGTPTYSVLMNHADEALYAAKRSGRDRFARHGGPTGNRADDVAPTLPGEPAISEPAIERSD